MLDNFLGLRPTAAHSEEEDGVDILHYHEIPKMKITLLSLFAQNIMNMHIYAY